MSSKDPGENPTSHHLYSSTILKHLESSLLISPRGISESCSYSESSSGSSLMWFPNITHRITGGCWSFTFSLMAAPQLRQSWTDKVQKSIEVSQITYTAFSLHCLLLSRNTVVLHSWLIDWYREGIILVIQRKITSRFVYSLTSFNCVELKS